MTAVVQVLPDGYPSAGDDDDTSRLQEPDASGPTSSDASRARRLCGWCEGPIRPTARIDSLYCKTLCRQAAHRFHRGRQARAAVALGRPLRVAYADPPYPKMAARYYVDHPDFAGEVDHSRLVEQLVDGYPDGWALSTSSPALRDVLALCPPEVKVAAWFRGERPTPSYSPLTAWEPVIYCGGRAYLSPVDERRVDALVHVARSRTTDPNRVVGAKPAAFLWWLFDLLGILPGDELVDLFPGSGGVARAWRYASDVASADASPPGSPDTSAEYSGDASRLTVGRHDASGLDRRGAWHRRDPWDEAFADASALAAARRDVSRGSGADG